MSNISLEKQPNENEEQFIWRLGQAKDSGILDLDWNELADVITTHTNDNAIVGT